MANLDLTRLDNRKLVIDQINQEENYSRKRESQRRFDVYRDRIDRYIIEALEQEFDPRTVKRMRKVLSINLSKQIIDSEASIYKKDPEREFLNADERELEQCQMLYEKARANTKFRIANQYYKLFDQGTLMVIPKNGIIDIVPIAPHMFDVVPDENDPEKAYAYILNVWDLDFHKSYKDMSASYQPRYQYNDQRNQVIADDNDRKARLESYVVWTKDYYFKMNGKGEITSEITPHIGILPFVDIATEKDFQFFVRRGSSVTQFAIDFGLAISDLANINRLQGYSQAIIYAPQMPTDVVVGPERILHLPMDPNNPDITPKFEFASPSPDLNAGLELLETQLRLFLSSRGQENTSISGKPQAQKYGSGIERMLAMLDTFEATRGDFDLFKSAEYETFQIMKAWSNLYQGATGEMALIPELNQGLISDDVWIEVKYQGPEAVQSKDDQLNFVSRQMELGLMSRVEAIAKLRDMSIEAAREKAIEIDQEVGLVSEREDQDQVRQSDVYREDGGAEDQFD